MSRSNTNTVSKYRPVEAKITIEFDSNIVNDDLRSPTWWAEQIQRIRGVKNVNVIMSRENVLCSR